MILTGAGFGRSALGSTPNPRHMNRPRKRPTRTAGRPCGEPGSRCVHHRRRNRRFMLGVDWLLGRSAARRTDGSAGTPSHSVRGRRMSLCTGEFNRSTQHPSLERTDCWCRSNFSIKGQDIRRRSRSFQRLRRYPPVLAALPALSALCLQLQHEPCPCMSLYMHAIPTWRIRVKGCCVDRLSPPPKSGHSIAERYRSRWATSRHARSLA